MSVYLYVTSASFWCTDPTTDQERIGVQVCQVVGRWEFNSFVLVCVESQLPLFTHKS